jgi:hypothetical protein
MFSSHQTLGRLVWAVVLAPRNVAVPIYFPLAHGILHTNQSE